MPYSTYKTAEHQKSIEASSPVFSQNQACVSQWDKCGNLNDQKECAIETEESPMEIDDAENDEYDCDEQNALHENNEILSSVTHNHKSARRLNNGSKSLKEDNDKSKLSFFIIFFVATVIFAWICYKGYYFVPAHKRYEHIMKIYPSLNKILDQDHVLGVTLENLNKLYEHNSFKNILVYVGATGVGKTHIANLVKQYFPQEYTIDINFHLLNDEDSLDISLNDCYFIIIDNLKMNDLEAVLTYINKLPDKCMLVLPIFNIHDVNDKLEYVVNYDNFYSIRTGFNRKFSSNTDIVLFNNINHYTLEKWLTKQMDEEEFADNKQDILSVLNEHDVENYGFKGLMTKIITALSSR